MAYNTKYILNFCNRKRVPIRVEIQIKDYVGEAFILVNEDDYLLDAEGRYITTNIDGAYDPDRDKNAIEGGGQPFVLTYQNDESEKSGAIRATKASMQFFENLLFNIDDLATSDETEIRTVLYYDNELEWIGYVIPDFFNVEITQNPLINLVAHDRLGILKDIPYPLISIISSRFRIMDILVNILNQTDLQLNINVVCQMYSNQFPDYGASDDYADYELNNPLYDVWVSEHRFVTDSTSRETMNCYEVLQSIMNQFNCLITQYKGEWWIVNKYDQSIGEGITFRYDYAGLFQGMDRTEFGEINFNLINTGGQRTLIPAGAKNTVLLDHGLDLTYPMNNIFDAPGIVATVPNYWVNNNGLMMLMSYNIPTEYDGAGDVVDYYQDSKINVRLNDTIIDDPNPSIGTVDVPWNEGNLESQPFPVGSVTEKTFDMEFSVQAVGKPRTGLLIRLCLLFEDDDLLFVSSHLDEGQSYYCYKYSELITSTDPYPVAFFEFNDEYNDQNIAVKSTFTVNKTTSIEYLKRVASVSGQVLNSEGFNDAKMFVRIYPGFSRDGGVSARIAIRHATVTFKNDNQTPKGTVFQTLLTSGNFTMPTDQKTVLFGDYQTTGQNGYFYKYREDSLSIQYNENGTRLKDWFTTYDSQLNSQLMHTLRQMTYAYGQAHDELKIGFELGNVNPLAQFAIRCYSDKRIIVNPEDEFLLDGRNRYITSRIGRYLNNKRFVLVEGSIDYLRSEFDGKLAQIRTAETDHQEYIYSQFDNDDIS